MKELQCQKRLLQATNGLEYASVITWPFARVGFSEKESKGSSRVKISLNWLRSEIQNHTLLQEELFMGHHQAKIQILNLHLTNQGKGQNLKVFLSSYLDRFWQNGLLAYYIKSFTCGMPMATLYLQEALLVLVV